MRVQYQRLSDVIGAEVLNVDISVPIEPAVFDQIRKIWLDHNTMKRKSFQVVIRILPNSVGLRV